VFGKTASALLSKLVLVLARFDHVALHVDHVDLLGGFQFVDLHFSKGLLTNTRTVGVGLAIWGTLVHTA